jgi:hypothetical protein
MRYLLLLTVIHLAPATWAQVYIHNTLPHVYKMARVDKKEGVLKYQSISGKKIKVPLTEVSVETDERIHGIKKNEVAILDGMFCQAFYVAISGRAEFTCRTGLIYNDSLNGATHHLEKYVAHTSEAIPEVFEMNGIKKRQYIKIKNNIEDIKSGSEVRVEAIFANGEILIKRTGFLRMGLIQTGGSSVRDIGTIRTHIKELNITR